MNASPAPPPAAFSRTLPARLEDAGLLLDDFVAWCTACGAAGRVVGQLHLMLDEITTNVILHGYHGDPAGTLTIDAECAGHRIVLTISDLAPPFDPLAQAPEPDLSLALDERPIGGLGMHLVRQMADEVSYARVQADGQALNRLRIVKRF